MTVTNQGKIVIWGSGLGGSIGVVCLNRQLEETLAKFPYGYTEAASVFGATYINNQVLLLGITGNQDAPVIQSWIVNPNSTCQIEELDSVALPRHFATANGDDIISPAGQVIRTAKDNEADFWRRYIANVFVIPHGQVIVFYYQYNDQAIKRDENGVITTSLQDLNASLWAMQFDPVTKKILWDRLVIANNDPAIEKLSLFPAAQPPQLSLAFMPNLKQLWFTLLNPSISGNEPEKTKTHLMHPRIYQLDIR